MSQYPEHEKLQAVKDQSQAIGEFLDFGGYTLCESKDPEDGWGPDYVPVMKPITKILAEYFEIDLDKIEAEKRQMLDELREANAR